MKIPGVIYSMLVAIGIWATDYFTVGSGGDWQWAAILVAGIPAIIKLFSVATSEPEPTNPTGAQARGFDGTVTPAPSKMRKFWLG